MKAPVAPMQPATTPVRIGGFDVWHVSKNHSLAAANRNRPQSHILEQIAAYRLMKKSKSIKSDR